MKRAAILDRQGEEWAFEPMNDFCFKGAYSICSLLSIRLASSYASGGFSKLLTRQHRYGGGLAGSVVTQKDEDLVFCHLHGNVSDGNFVARGVPPAPIAENFAEMSNFDADVPL